MKTHLIAALLATTAFPAIAQSTDASATARGTSQPEVIPITDNVVLVNTNNMYESFESNNPDNPLIRLSGPCKGAVLIANGKPDGGGFCHFADTDDHVAIIKFTFTSINAAGHLGGNWELVSGSDTWAGMSGGGAFQLENADEGR